LIVLVLGLVSTASAYDSGDLQLWSTNSISIKLNDSVGVGIEEEFKFGNNIREFYYHHGDIGFSYKMADWMIIGFNYRQIFELKSGAWKKEDRPHINKTLKWMWGALKLEDRSRLEYRVKEGSDHEWRYRNKIACTFPQKWTGFNLQPYLADEIFLDFKGDGLNKNRVYAGLKTTLIAKVKGELYYLLESGKSGDVWPGINVIGLKFKVAI